MKYSKPEIAPEIPKDCELALKQAYLNEIDPAETQFILQELPISQLVFLKNSEPIAEPVEMLPEQASILKIESDEEPILLPKIVKNHDFIEGEKDSEPFTLPNIRK